MTDQTQTVAVFSKLLKNVSMPVPSGGQAPLPSAPPGTLWIMVGRLRIGCCPSFAKRSVLPICHRPVIGVIPATRVTLRAERFGRQIGFVDFDA